MRVNLAMWNFPLQLRQGKRIRPKREFRREIRSKRQILPSGYFEFLPTHAAHISRASGIIYVVRRELKIPAFRRQRNACIVPQNLAVLEAQLSDFQIEEALDRRSALFDRDLWPREVRRTVPFDAHVRGEMRHDDVPQGNLTAPKRFHMNIEIQSVGMKQGRGSRRLASVQGESIEPHVQGPPFDMEIAEFHARPGRPLKLLHDRAPRPAVRESAHDDVHKRETNGHRCNGGQCHPMFQAEFSLLVAHLLVAQLPTNELPGITASQRAPSIQSSDAILFLPAISRPCW